MSWSFLDMKSTVGVPSLVATIGTVSSLIMGFPIAYILFAMGQTHWCNENLPFVPFAIFLGVGMGISDLPITARILAAKRMLHLTIGVFAIAAAAVGLLETWIIGEISTSLMYVQWSPLHILWNVLIAIADFLILFAVLRPILVRIVKKVEEEQELSMMNFFFIVVIVLGFSALAEYTTLTSSLGAMCVGIVMPRGAVSAPTSGGQIVRQQMGDRLEDIISLFFLPLFFTQSGLRTKLRGLQGVDVAMCLLIFIVSFGSKVISCAAATRIGQIFPFRESMCFAILMQSKGLMALIVFNNAYTAGIITNRMFTLLVIFVLISTFVTTPMIDWVLPAKRYLSSPSQKNNNQFCALVFPQSYSDGKAMASIVASLLASNSTRRRDLLLPDRMVTVKLLKDTQRSSTPFMNLILTRREGLQRHIVKRDPVLAAVRKRMRDIGVPSTLLHTSQKVHVSGGDMKGDIAHLADSIGADLVLVSGPAPSPARSATLPRAAGLPPLTLSEDDLALLSLNNIPKDIGVFYDKGTVRRRVGRVLCAVLLGYEKAGSCALKLCAKMRPKVDVQVLHIMAPGVADNLGVLNNLINTCIQKSMEYKVAVNSNPIAALFEELGALDLAHSRDSGSIEEMADSGSETSSDSSKLSDQPYSLLVLGTLPNHLANFVLNRVTCSTLVVYPRTTEIEPVERAISDNASSVGDVEMEEPYEHNSNILPKDHSLVLSQQSIASDRSREELPPAPPPPAPYALPYEIWGRICLYLDLPSIADLSRVSQQLNRVLSSNVVWAEITTSLFPDSQPNAASGVNWKQTCLLYHSRTHPHLALRGTAATPVPGIGKFFLLSMIFIGDDTEMGYAESMFFMKRISKNAVVTSADSKSGVMTLVYGNYYFLTAGMSRIPQVIPFWEHSAAIVITCLQRTNHNTNVDTIINRKTMQELNNMVQQVIPTAPLIVFFHYNSPMINNTNSNSAVDSVFVKKLNDTLSELILKSRYPLRKLLVQPYNFRSNFGFSDGLWWMTNNLAPMSLTVEQIQLTWRGPTRMEPHDT